MPRLRAARGRKFRQDAQGIVGGAVVDGDDFEGRIAALAFVGAQHARDAVRAVVARHDDRKNRPGRRGGRGTSGDEMR